MLAVACGTPVLGDDDDDDDGAGFRTVAVPDTDDGVTRTDIDTITGIHCESPTACAIATRNRDHGGALFVTTDGAALTPVFTSADIEAQGLIGHAQFLNVDDTGAGWIARVDVASPLVMAAAEPTTAASWSLVDPGTNEGESDFAVLNNQELVRAADDGTWLYVYSGVMWMATQPPGPSTAWTGLWSPGRVPPFPEDYDALKAADPTLCESGPAVNSAPDFGQLGYASPDLGLVIYPAGGPNQDRAYQGSTDAPGVCVSRDRGQSFHVVAFDGLDPAQVGPVVVDCIDADRCWAIGGVEFDGAPAYVYYSTDASAAAPTWTAATVPSQEDRDSPRGIAFAPDGQHGWLVGDRGLVWRTGDGGATWTDASADIAAVAGADLTFQSAAVIDADHVWLGGDDGTLLRSD
jgi:hypothetical protein